MTDLAIPASESSTIARIEWATTQLAHAVTVDDVKDIRDKAEAIRHFLKQQEGSLRAQNYAAALKLRAERRLGEMLADTIPHEGGRPIKPSHDERVSRRLEDYGLNYSASHRFQTIAAIPAPHNQSAVCARLSGASGSTGAGRSP